VATGEDFRQLREKCQPLSSAQRHFLRGGDFSGLSAEDGAQLVRCGMARLVPTSYGASVAQAGDMDEGMSGIFGQPRRPRNSSGQREE